MNRHATTALILISLMLTLTLTALQPATANANSTNDWSMFHANPSHTGVGTGNPVTSPTLLWKTNITYVPPAYLTGNVREIETTWSSPAIDDGAVYISSSTQVNTLSGYGTTGWGDLYAINATNGATIWDHRDNINGLSGSSPAVANGNVFFASGDAIGALKASDGASLWNFTTQNAPSSTVVGGVVYVGASNPGSVLALNATNGNLIWNSTIGSPSRDANVFSSPAVVNGAIYVGSDDNNVYALNATNGVKIWNYTTGNAVSSSPAVVNGVVYVGSEDGNVYALNADNGDKIWNYNTDGIYSFHSVVSSPAVVSGLAYVGAEDGNVYALNSTSGAKLWNYTTGYGVGSSPAVVDGYVYVQSATNNPGYAEFALENIYAFNAQNGEKLWNYTIYGNYTSITASPAVANGVLYVGSGDGQVYALGTLSSSPSPSPTPSQTASSSPPPTSSTAPTASPTTTQSAIPTSNPNPTTSIPEFPIWVILPLLMISVLVTDLYLKRKLKTR